MALALLEEMSRKLTAQHIATAQPLGLEVSEFRLQLNVKHAAVALVPGFEEAECYDRFSLVVKLSL